MTNKRNELVNKASVISEDAKDGKYDYFPSDFNKLETSEIECYLDAYRNVIPNLYEDNEDSFNDLVDSFKVSFTHEVSFTTNSSREFTR